MSADGTEEALAARWRTLEPRFERLARGVVGSTAEAEDVVQTAWLRLRTQEDPVRDLEAWGRTTVTRLALDAAGSARARHERPAGTWLPEFAVAGPGPDDAVLLAEEVELGLRRVLDRLSPAERCAFLLREVFSLSFAEVGRMMGTSEPAARQLGSRARRAVRDGRPRRPVDREEHLRVLRAFVAATAEGDLEGLVALLHPDVVHRSDGGGRVPVSAAPLRGARRVAGVLIALARTAEARGGLEGAVVDVDGRPGLLLRADGVVSVLRVDVDGGLVHGIDVQRDPAKVPAGPALRRLLGA